WFTVCWSCCPVPLKDFATFAEVCWNEKATCRALSTTACREAPLSGVTLQDEKFWKSAFNAPGIPESLLTLKLSSKSERLCAFCSSVPSEENCWRTFCSANASRALCRSPALTPPGRPRLG